MQNIVLLMLRVSIVKGSQSYNAVAVSFSHKYKLNMPKVVIDHRQEKTSWLLMKLIRLL